MEVTNYSRRQHSDPDVQVSLTVDGHEATGFIDARRQVDGVWQALVDYSYPAENGFPSHRSDWFPMDQLTVLTIDDVPQGDITPSAGPNQSDAPTEPADEPDADA